MEGLINCKSYFINFVYLYLKSCQNLSLKNGLMNKPAEPDKMYVPSLYEHIANTYSHGMMIVPSILAGQLLLSRLDGVLNQQNHICSSLNSTMFDHKSLKIDFLFSTYIYTISLAMLFICSTLYHWLSWTQSHWINNHTGCSKHRPFLTKWLHKCDRSTIYIFIAASYSPWLILTDHSKEIGIELLVWLAAVCGTIYTLCSLEKNKLLETVFYIFVGLFPGLFLINYVNLNQTVIYEFKLGGAFYLIGVLIFKYDGRVPFAHAIWHLFVAMGAFTHYRWFNEFFAENKNFCEAADD